MNVVTRRSKKRQESAILQIIPTFWAGAVVVLGWGTAAAQVEDITPPELTDFFFTPTAIDTATGEAIVTVTLQALDQTGVCVSPCSSGSPTQVRFEHPATGQFQDGIFALVAGTLNDGTFEAQLSFPQFSAAGTWKVVNLLLSDATGNVVFLSEADLESQGFRTELRNTSTVEDLAPPTLVDFSFTRTTIDTATGDESVTVTLELTDVQTGVCVSPCSSGSPTQVRFEHPATGQFQDGIFSLVAGTLNDGTFEAELIFPQFSAAGTWKVVNLLLSDAIGNVVFLSETALAAQGRPTELVNTATVDDLVPPTLVSLALNPTTIDTTTGDETIIVTVQLTDSQSGVCLSTCADLGSPTQVGFQHPASGQFQVGLFNLVAGTLNDGTVEADVTFPQFSAIGTWNVVNLLLVDFIGNRAFVSEAHLAAQGFPAELINVAPTPENDTCSNAIAINLGATAFDTTAAATDGFDLSGFCDLGPFGDDIVHDDIWFRFEAPDSGIFRLSTCNQASYNTRLAIYDDNGNCPPLPQDVIGCNDDGVDDSGEKCTDLTSLLDVDLVRGEPYLIQVGGFDETDQGMATLQVGFLCTRLSEVSVSATSETTVPQNGHVTFEASAMGSKPFSFEWDFDENGVIDATGPAPTTRYPNAGDFDVTLTLGNPCSTEEATLADLVTVVSMGDFDADGKLELPDALCLLNFLFAFGETPICLAAMDFDADSRLDLIDALDLLNFLFVPGSTPATLPLNGTPCQ